MNAAITDLHDARFVELSGVNKAFATRKGVFLALQDVNLTIRKGEFISIIGHSGCGKSTVLNLIAGLLEASSGVLICNGREIAGPDTMNSPPPR